jgi:hypothetical protein
LIGVNDEGVVEGNVLRVFRIARTSVTLNLSVMSVTVCRKTARTWHQLFSVLTDTLPGAWMIEAATAGGRPSMFLKTPTGLAETDGLAVRRFAVVVETRPRSSQCDQTSARSTEFPRAPEKSCWPPVTCRFMGEASASEVICPVMSEYALIRASDIVSVSLQFSLAEYDSFRVPIPD